MEVLVKIPKDLERYIEYIPKEALPGILTSLVKESILNKVNDGVKPPQPVVGMEALLSLLQQNNMQLPVMKQVGVQPESVVEEERVELSPVHMESSQMELLQLSDDDDDMDDFMDMLK